MKIEDNAIYELNSDNTHLSLLISVGAGRLYWHKFAHDVNVTVTVTVYFKMPVRYLILAMTLFALPVEDQRKKNQA
jgi:hypothetical protein